jgi:hypothetical protein
MLKGQHVIAVNLAYKFVPDFDAFVCMDSQFYEWEYEGLSKFSRVAFAILGYFETPRMHDMGQMEVRFLENTGLDGIDYTEGKVRCGGNSGYTALGVAIHLGAKDIRLLGMDLVMLNPNEPYFFQQDFVYGKREHSHLTHYLPSYFPNFKRDLKPDIKITNYSMISKIEVFPKKELSQILED